MTERARTTGLAIAAAVRPALLLGWSVVVIVVLGGLGIAYEAGVPLGLFDLDVEGTVPAGWSAGLLLAGGGLGLLLASLELPADEREHAWVAAFGGFLVFMGLDEGLRVHENLDAWLDFDWQVIYLPIAVAGGYAGLVTVRVLARMGERARLLVAGAGCWVVAQLIEAFQHAGEVRPGSIDGGKLSEEEFERASQDVAYVTSMIVEELLEMAGSLLFVLVLLGAVRALAGAARPARAAEAAGQLG